MAVTAPALKPVDVNPAAVFPAIVIPAEELEDIETTDLSTVSTLVPGDVPPVVWLSPVCVLVRAAELPFIEVMIFLPSAAVSKTAPFEVLKVAVTPVWLDLVLIAAAT